MTRPSSQWCHADLTSTLSSARGWLSSAGSKTAGLHPWSLKRSGLLLQFLVGLVDPQFLHILEAITDPVMRPPSRRRTNGNDDFVGGRRIGNDEGQGEEVRAGSGGRDVGHRNIHRTAGTAA